MSERFRIGTVIRAVTVIAAALGLVVTPSAQAQEFSPSAPIDELFGGYIVDARANGFRMTYDSPGLLPVGSPIFDLTAPEAYSSMSNGPASYALASFAYPGPLVADLGSVISQTGNEAPIPEYPIRTQAFFPAGPTQESSGEAGTEMTVTTAEGDARSVASFAGFQAPPALYVGGVRSTSVTTIEDDQVVSRARSEVSDLNLLLGLIRIESVITDIVATSNGEVSATDGTTTVSGVTVAGMAAELTEDGIRFVDAPPADDSPAADGGILGGLGEQLGPAADPINELIGQVTDGSDEALQQLMEQSGIEIRLLSPVETVAGGTATRLANGVYIAIDYDGANTPVLTDLLDAVPADQLPADDIIPGAPSSPRAAYELLRRQHIETFSIAPASVEVAATTPFVFDFPAPTSTPTPNTPPLTTRVTSPAPAPVALSSPPTIGGGGGGGTAEIATPELPPPPAPVVVAAPAAATHLLPLGPALPVALIILTLFAAPFLAVGAGKLVDNQLATATTSCPEGLDVPSQGGDRS